MLPAPFSLMFKGVCGGRQGSLSSKRKADAHSVDQQMHGLRLLILVAVFLPDLLLFVLCSLTLHREAYCFLMNASL